MNSGRWKHGVKAVAPWWFNFDSYPYIYTGLRRASVQSAAGKTNSIRAADVDRVRSRAPGGEKHNQTPSGLLSVFISWKRFHRFALKASYQKKLACVFQGKSTGESTSLTPRLGNQNRTRKTQGGTLCPLQF